MYLKSFENFATLHLGWVSQPDTHSACLHQQKPSKSFNIDCGVPQGSYSGLGPILFIIYLGDSTSLRTTYLVSICMQMISSCLCLSCYCRHLLKMMYSEQSKLQSQTKIVGTLPPNTVSTSGPSPRPPNVVYGG